MSRGKKTVSDPEFEKAEQALFASEGVVAESLFVDLKRLDSTVRVLIAGDGPPVLFVPGAMTGGAGFAGLVGRLPDYRCIMIDRPGTGMSPALPSQSMDFAVQERSAEQLLVDIQDGLGLERSHLVCTSAGGFTGFRSAAAHPHRFLRISAMAYVFGARITTAPWTMRMPAPKPLMKLMPRRFKVPRGLYRSMMKISGMRAAIEGGKFSDEMLDYMVALAAHTESFRNEGIQNPRPYGMRGPVDQVRATPEMLAKITAPVHLFWGDEDILAGAESAYEFAALLPNAEVQMVAGAGHAPWLDEPDLAAEAVRRHLGAILSA